MSRLSQAFSNVNERILIAIFGGWKLWVWVVTIMGLEIIGLRMYLEHLTSIGTHPLAVFAVLLMGIGLIIDAQGLYIFNVKDEYDRLKEASASNARDNTFGG